MKKPARGGLWYAFRVGLKEILKNFSLETLINLSPGEIAALLALFLFSLPVLFAAFLYGALLVGSIAGDIHERLVTLKARFVAKPPASDRPAGSGSQALNKTGT